MTQKPPFALGIVIVAAGRGERAGASAQGPKQYRHIAGLPIIRHTLNHFLSWGKASRIVVSIHADDIAFFEAARAGLEPNIPLMTVIGGATRQESVRNGLEALAHLGLTHVFIHDAVRPFFDADLLDRISAALMAGDRAILPATAVADTLKRVTNAYLVHETVSRERLYAAQTPQAFCFDTILAAHRKAEASGMQQFTDDAAIAEWASVPVRVVEGLVENFKITTRQDIDMANERLLQGRLPDVRCGNGYDVHQLEDGDGVTLCGIFIPHTKKLKGHSDADVGLHALTDALLATCGAGDIGDHFPPSDPQWKGVASRIFVEHAAKIVRGKGGTIMNADISLIAESPRVGPHRDSMRARMAEMLGIDMERCSVKATTNEKIGFIGREEGIAAIATATVVYQGE
jgi:2-C-methyl-D-erythritol 4-phosphate cytidylyltransferase / 2-C-methyl-D-erythritol 2,4-cyclodiphosphate synthase